MLLKRLPLTAFRACLKVNVEVFFKSKDACTALKLTVKTAFCKSEEGKSTFIGYQTSMHLQGNEIEGYRLHQIRCHICGQYMEVKFKYDVGVILLLSTSLFFDL